MRDDDDPVTGRRFLTQNAQREFGEPFDYDAMLAYVAAGVEREIEANGRFRAVSRASVFICR